jgi:predicted transcriptional regulator
MQQLTKAEEQLMEQLWKLEKAFMKDLLQTFPDQNQKRQRFATKRMIDKDFVANEFETQRILSIVKKKPAVITANFSTIRLTVRFFFTTETNLSSTELEDLKK